MEVNFYLNDILDRNLHNVLYFQMLMEEQNLSPRRVAIVLANSADTKGRTLAKLVLPGLSWDKYISLTGNSLALGLAWRHLVSSKIKKINPKSCRELQLIDGVPVVVVDKGMVDVFNF